MNKWLKYALIALGFIFAVTFIQSCNNAVLETNEQLVEQPKPTLAPAQDEEVEVNWTDEDVEEIASNNEEALMNIYIDGCVAEDVSYSYCRCTWDELRVDHSVADILRMGDDFTETGDIPADMMLAISSCLDEL